MTASSACSYLSTLLAPEAQRPPHCLACLDMNSHEPHPSRDHLPTLPYLSEAALFQRPSLSLKAWNAMPGNLLRFSHYLGGKKKRNEPAVAS